jgi:hypothetical protein
MSTEPPGRDDTFAEVFNELTLGRRAKRRRPPGDSVPEPWRPAPVAGEQAWFEPGVSSVELARPAGGLDFDRLAAELGTATDASIVRPYSWTRGRTKSSVELRIEALVTTSDRGDRLEAIANCGHRAVARICRLPRSVAEIATLLDVPLGVAKVLVGDMHELGLVVVHKTASGGANKQHLLLMERVLSGLRRL